MKNDVARFTTYVKTCLTTTTRFCELRESRLLIGELSAPLWAVPNKASLVDLLDVVFFFNQAHFLSQSSSLHFSIIIVDVFGLRDGVRIGDSDQDNGKCEPAAMQTLFRLKKHHRIVRESSMKGAQQPIDGSKYAQSMKMISLYALRVFFANLKLP